MANRVTDQTTQNALIAKFRLEGVLPEMEVLPSIIPVVNVANLDSALTISEFEKWRSVLSHSLPLVNPNDMTFTSQPFQVGIHNISATTNHISGNGTLALNGFLGVKLPGASIATSATDGIYRITVFGVGTSGSRGVILATLVGQSAFGPAAPPGVLRKNLGMFSLQPDGELAGPIFDVFVPILSTDLSNAFRLETVASVVTGSAFVQIIVTKMIDKVPPFVIFP